MGGGGDDDRTGHDVFVPAMGFRTGSSFIRSWMKAAK